jgi:hypothetical protein
MSSVVALKVELSVLGVRSFLKILLQKWLEALLANKTVEPSKDTFEKPADTDIHYWGCTWYCRFILRFPVHGAATFVGSEGDRP